MSMQIVLQNVSKTPLFAHITGTADKGLCYLSADGQPVYPSNPAATMQPVQDSAISIAANASKTITIPRIAGGRIWFSQETPLKFFVNPGTNGPALVEPSATNTADQNYKQDWGFCEFTFNQYEAYINVSYVDFVSLPIALKLENESGQTKSVAGMPNDGLQKVAAGLTAQGGDWAKLVVQESGKLLRVLSPNAGSVLYPDFLKGYYTDYVNECWAKYEKEDLTVNTQFKWGDAKGRVTNGILDFGDAGKFAKPVERDIWSCNSGPFDHGGASDEQLNIGARIAAALNRSTLDKNSVQPNGEKVDEYYKESVTNHYARVCHEVAVEGRGYAFAYDDVGADGGKDQSGFVNDPKPKVLTVTVGGV